MRLADPSRNADPASAEQITVSVGTRAGAAARDDQSDLTLEETGPDTGVFVSEPHLLTAPDLSMVARTDQDDGFEVHSRRTGGTVPDDDPDDRTHQASIDDRTRIELPGGGADPVRRQIPVSRRGDWQIAGEDFPQDARRLVQLRVHVFNEPHEDDGLDGVAGTGDAGEGNGAVDAEPFDDFGTDGMAMTNDADGSENNGIFDMGEPFDDVGIDGTAGTGDPGEGNGMWDGERHADVSGDGVVNTVLGSQADARAFVEQQVKRATIGWAQAGIKAEMVGINFEDAPDDAAGDNILIDGTFDFPADNDRVVATRPAGSVQEDVLQAFIVSRISITLNPARRFNAFAVLPDMMRPGVGENTFTFIGRNPVTNTVLRLQNRTVAHEIGHALDNLFNPDADRLFPNEPYVFYPANRTFSDDVPDRYRRMRHDNEARARVRRPSGRLGDPGNRLLEPGN